MNRTTVAPSALQAHYPWTSAPLIVSAPMRLISTAPLACAVSLAGGLGFVGAGTDLSTLASYLSDAAALLASTPLAPTQTSSHTSTSATISTSNPPAKPLLPIGIGIIMHSASLPLLLSTLRACSHAPAAIWLFAPTSPSDLTAWAAALTALYAPHPPPPLWLQAGSVADALAGARACSPAVLVVQGADAGGHGLAAGAGIVALLPEVADALADLAREAELEGRTAPALVAAGGIGDARGVAAAVALGAAGACMGTRFLACPEAVLSRGYRDAVLAARDGGVSTVRSRLYDTLRGTHGWPARYGARGVVNASWRDAQAGMGEAENRALYEEAVAKGDEGWGGEQGRMTTYAGAAVGLVGDDGRGAGEVTREVREGAVRILRGVAARI